MAFHQSGNKIMYTNHVQHDWGQGVSLRQAHGLSHGNQFSQGKRRAGQKDSSHTDVAGRYEHIFLLLIFSESKILYFS